MFRSDGLNGRPIQHNNKEAIKLKIKMQCFKSAFNRLKIESTNEKSHEREWDTIYFMLFVPIQVKCTFYNFGYTAIMKYL